LFSKSLRINDLTNSFALAKPPSRYIAPITASQASDTIESLFLPPVNSSPLPNIMKLSIPIALAHIASVGSHTILARSLVIWPSFILL
jgi:hypothetical protein